MARRRDGMRRGSRRSFSGLLITARAPRRHLLAVKTRAQPAAGAADRAARLRPGRDGQAGQAARQVLAAEGPRRRRPRRRPTRSSCPTIRTPRRRPSRRRSSRTRRSRRTSSARSSARASWSALAVPDEPDEGSLTGSKPGTSNQAIGDQYIATDQGRCCCRTTTCPAGMNADQIPTPPEIRFRIASRRDPLRHQADEDVRQPAGRRRLRERRAADAQGPAAARRDRRFTASTWHARSKPIRGI